MEYTISILLSKYKKLLSWEKSGQNYKEKTILLPE